MRAIMSLDRSKITLAGPTYRFAFPVETLAAWLRFYRREAARKGGRYAAHYQPTIAALEKIEARIRETAT